MKIVSIHSNTTQIHLVPVIYYIDIIGGFGAELNDFSISFTNVETGEVLRPKKTEWLMHSLDSSRKIRVLDLTVNKPGKYQVDFSNAHRITLKKSLCRPFPFSLLPNRNVPNREIKIAIYRKD